MSQSGGNAFRLWISCTGSYPCNFDFISRFHSLSLSRLICDYPHDAANVFLFFAQLPKGPTRLSLDISTVSEAKGRGESTGRRGCVGRVRVRVVGRYFPRIRAASVGGGGEVARRWRALQTFSAQV